MRTLSTFKPTDNQMKILAMLAANKDKPNVAAKQLSGDANIVGARDLLMKMNIITYSDTDAALTDLGTSLAVDSGIIDDSGNLTDLGNKLTSTDNQNNEIDNPIDLDTSGGSEFPEPPDDTDLMDQLEGFSPLFSSLLL